MMRHPLHIYCNWSAYDELSDRVALTATVAMTQFEHLLRLRQAGMRLDGYLMDCFWYEPGSAYRQFRQAHWPDGGAGWLEACRRAGVLPGLWFACNGVGTFCGLEVAPGWAGSVDPGADRRYAAACLFEGPFLADFMAALDHWYQRGVRIFKLDFLNLNAQLPHHRLSLLAQEIRALNAEAFRTALRTFRRLHPQSILMAYNGFEEDTIMSSTDFQLRKTLDHRWLEAVDTFYSGDPRPADVPSSSFWRSKDVYSDHMVRAYLAQGFRPQVIDNAGFMIGTTGTCYYRGIQAWKGMAVLALARGGWATTYYGNLDLLSDEDARWFARLQQLLGPLVHHGMSSVIGGMPGAGCAYGFVLQEVPAAAARGARAEGTAEADRETQDELVQDGVICVVNPGQAEASLALPCRPGVAMRLLFQDAGFMPRQELGGVVLGAEQLAVVGIGRYANASWDLGVQEDVRSPLRTRQLALTTTTTTTTTSSSIVEGRNRARATTIAPVQGRLRVIARQRSGGVAKRTTGGAPPAGMTLGKLLVLGVRQAGRELPVITTYDHAIWSGLSWAVGEVAASSLRPGEPIEVSVESQEPTTVELSLEAWEVDPG